MLGVLLQTSATMCCRECRPGVSPSLPEGRMGAHVMRGVGRPTRARPSPRLHGCSFQRVFPKQLRSDHISRSVWS